MNAHEGADRGRRLRVLWVTPAQFPAATGIPSMRGGGWMEGWRWTLESFHPEIDLHILSQGSVCHEPLTSGNATYYSFPPIELDRSSRLRQRLVHQEPGPILEQGRRFLGEVVASAAPDLIHVHGSESGLVQLLAEPPVPVLVSLQGVATVWQDFAFAGATWREVAMDVLRPRTYKGYGLIHAYMGLSQRAAVEQSSMKRCRYVLGNTEWDRRVADVLFPTAEYFRADRAVRREFYHGAWNPPIDANRVIYCTGGTAPYKGLETLLRAISLLVSRGERGLQLRIAGSLENSIRWSHLRGMVRKLGLETHVEWLGSIDASAIVAELERAAVFVQPSHIENESNVVIEAMLVGAPCIVSAVGGIPSIVQDGTDGLLYHDRDAYSLAGAIRLLLSDRDKAAALAEQGRKTAHQRHDPRKVADQLVSVYGEIIEATGVEASGRRRGSS